MRNKKSVKDRWRSLSSAMKATAITAIIILFFVVMVMIVNFFGAAVAFISLMAFVIWMMAYICFEACV